MSSSTRLPADPGVDRRARRGRELARLPWAVLGSVAVGGALGALGRYGLAIAWPHAPGHFPWATFVVNASGCFLMGILMVLITEVWSAHRLIRPFLGVGVLGGYTTFSTYAGEVQQLLGAGAARTGLLYLISTPVVALAAVYIGITLTRLATRRPRRQRRSKEGS